MTQFAFKARGEFGIIEGLQEAESPSDLAHILAGKGLIPLSINQQGKDSSASSTTSGKVSAPVTLPGFLQPKVQAADLLMFSRQIHALFKAGVPLLRSLSCLQETAHNPKMKEVLIDLRHSLESGMEMSVAMLKHPKVFDTFYISMVRVGEASGKLEEVFHRLFKHIEFEMFMKQQVKSALRYPMFVIFSMVMAVGVINVMVIPAFAGIFKNLKNGIPFATKVLMVTSDFTVRYGWWLAGAAVVGFILWRYWVKTPSGKMSWDTFLLRAPIVGRVVRKASLSRFTRAFALSLKSGVPLEKALQGVASAADNSYICKRMEGMKDRVVDKGNTLTAAAAWTGEFTPMALQMFSIGEETGMIDDMLEEIGELYNNEVQYELKTLSQQIEPILVLFMGGLVLILALGVFVPMWSLGDATFK